MDKEKMNARELTEKELEQVSGGIRPEAEKEKLAQSFIDCGLMYNEYPCGSPQKGQLGVCATCSKNN